MAFLNESIGRSQSDRYSVAVVKARAERPLRRGSWEGKAPGCPFEAPDVDGGFWAGFPT